MRAGSGGPLQSILACFPHLASCLMIYLSAVDIRGLMPTSGHHCLHLRGHCVSDARCDLVWQLRDILQHCLNTGQSFLKGLIYDICGHRETSWDCESTRITMHSLRMLPLVSHRFKGIYLLPHSWTSPTRTCLYDRCRCMAVSGNGCNAFYHIVLILWVLFPKDCVFEGLCERAVMGSR